MLEWVQVRTVVGTFRVVSETLLCCLGCELRVTVLLEGELKTHDAATIMLYCLDNGGQVTSNAWIPPDMIFRIEARQFDLGFIRPENPVSLCESPLGKPSQNRCFHLATLPYIPHQWRTAVSGCSSGSFLHHDLWNLARVAIRLPPFAQAVKSGPGGSELFQLRTYGGHCALGNHHTAEFFVCSLSQTSPPGISCLRTVMAVPLRFGLYSWYALSAVRPYYRPLCLLSKCPDFKCLNICCQCSISVFNKFSKNF